MRSTRLPSPTPLLTAPLGLPKHRPQYCEARPHLQQQVGRIWSHRAAQFASQISCGTCRIDTIEKNGLDFAKNLSIRNVRDLCKLMQVGQITRFQNGIVLISVMKWNEDNKYE